jgi:hypothetical protein
MANFSVIGYKEERKNDMVYIYNIVMDNITGIEFTELSEIRRF